jgi:glyoxylase-like metal-dependent hydrolase (beta-lactamase superfamily II)
MTTIHTIRTPLGDRFADLYLFAGARQSVLYDTGVAGSVPAHVLPYLAEHALDPATISHVVVSHCDVDHFGGIGDVHEHLSAAAVVAHAADAPLMADFEAYGAGRGEPFAASHGVEEGAAGRAWQRSVTREGRVDVLVSGGEVIDLGDRAVRVLHLPGHSLGSVGVWDPAEGALAISDAILGSAVPTATGEPAFPPTYRHVAEYTSTIARVRALRPSTLLTAHYGIYEGAATTAFLDESQRFVDELDALVLRVIRAAGRAGTTLPELLEGISGHIGAWPVAGERAALAFPVMGHVERFAARGEVDLDITDRRHVFRTPA